MDIARPSNVRQKRIRQGIVIGIGLVVIAAVSVGLSRLQPAAPSVEAATLWPDTVKRGPMVLQVRGLGTLVPEDIRWIPATTQGRVERILLRPGTTVMPDSVTDGRLSPPFFLLDDKSRQLPRTGRNQNSNRATPLFPSCYIHPPHA